MHIWIFKTDMLLWRSSIITVSHYKHQRSRQRAASLMYAIGYRQRLCTIWSIQIFNNILNFQLFSFYVHLCLSRYKVAFDVEIKLSCTEILTKKKNLRLTYFMSILKNMMHTANCSSKILSLIGFRLAFAHVQTKL